MQTNWLSQLKRWIRRLFKGKKKRYTSTEIIQSWNNFDCIVHEIDRNTPGAIATYRINRINHINFSYDYLITLDYLKKRQSRQTHRLGILRIWTDGSIHCIKGWDIDLEGLSASPGIQQRAPKQAIKYVVLSVLEIPLSWQFGIEDIDWLFLLRNRISEELSNPNHNLHTIIVFSVVETGTAR